MAKNATQNKALPVRTATAPRIRLCSVAPDHVALTWDDDRKTEHSTAWLRDWCDCQQCRSRRDIVSAAVLDLPAVPKPRVTEICADGGLLVVWDPDGHQSQYEPDFLRAHSGRHPGILKGHSSLSLSAGLPEMGYGSFKNDKNMQLDALEHVREFGFVLLRDVPDDPDEVGQIARSVGYIEGGWRYAAQPQEILVTPVEKKNKKAAADEAMQEANDALFRRTLLVPHTDFSFTSWPPGLFIFHCLRPSLDSGGATLLVDGFHVAERLRVEDPVAFSLLSTVRQRFRGHGSVKIDWHADGRVISVDDTGTVTGIRFALSSRRPLSLAHNRATGYHRATQTMLRLLLDKDCQTTLPLGSGDCLLMDNHRILHGRTGMHPTASETRWFRRFDVERDAVQTRMRLLARQLGREAAPLPSGAHG